MLSDADMYSEQMKGFEEYDKTTREKIECNKLKTALEGRRQSGNLWQVQASTDFLKSYAFTQFWGEPCIFTLKRGGSFLLVIFWIDDLAIAYANKDKALFDQFATAYESASEAIPSLVSTNSSASISPRSRCTHAHAIAGALHQEDGWPLPAEQDAAQIDHYTCL
eukprot:323362-Pleurochrysis_carterae.AAC.1